MANKSFHITDNGEVLPCTATQKQCKYSKHFVTYEEAILYIEQQSETLINYNTEKELTVHIDENALFEENSRCNMILENARKRLERYTEKQYPPFKEKFTKSYCKKNDTDYCPESIIKKAFKRTRTYGWHKKKLKELERSMAHAKEIRQVVGNILDQMGDDIIDKSYSDSSPSVYAIVNKSACDKMEKLCREAGFEVEKRDFLKLTKGDTFEIRFSDHYPVQYIKNKDEEKTLWDCTSCSMLAMY